MTVRLLLSAAACLLLSPNLAAAEESAQNDRLFEMRIYTTHPGKLDALHERFKNHTTELFRKHGMQVLGFWTPAEGDGAENTLIYLLAHKNREARDKSFAAFREDPAWQKAYAESRQDGPIVEKVESKFLNPTAYSDIK